MTKETGGPAFPKFSQTLQATDGMTLRDYFAAKAMPWVASNLAASNYSYRRVAETSYEIADFMLEARK